MQGFYEIPPVVSEEMIKWLNLMMAAAGHIC